MNREKKKNITLHLLANYIESKVTQLFTSFPIRNETNVTDNPTLGNEEANVADKPKYNTN